MNLFLQISSFGIYFITCMFTELSEKFDFVETDILVFLKTMVHKIFRSYMIIYFHPFLRLIFSPSNLRITMTAKLCMCHSKRYSNTNMVFHL